MAELYTDNEVEPTPSQSEPTEKKAEDPSTSVLPKSFFKDKELEPGSLCEIEIVEVYDDSVEVRYASDESEVEPETEMPMEAPPMGGGGMSEMME